MSDTYRLKLAVGRRVLVEARELTREEFYEWLWACFGNAGMLGVHEGTLLSEAAAEQGLETESWTVDAAEAPRERDWVGGQSEALAEVYFASRKQADSASKIMGGLRGVRAHGVEHQPERDWDAEWKASFLGSAEGLRVPPDWRVIPYWVTDEQAKLKAGEVAIRINPGAGFGTGTHETTQLCLGAIAEAVSRARAPHEVRALDFGSGSGILSIGLALRGVSVDAIEIDPLAIENARENAKLNSVDALVRFDETIPTNGPFDIVVANILRPVLLEFANELIGRLGPYEGGPWTQGAETLILSGLIERDVAEVSARYSKQLLCEPEVRALGDWRCLIFRRYVKKS